MNFVTFLAVTAITPCALATSFHFQFLPTSTAQQSLTLSYPLAGTFIGAYHAATNPLDTKTLPGLFGGSGNIAIAYTSTMRMSDSIDSNPLGTFSLRIGAGGTCEVTGFATDLVNETPGTVAVEMVIAYPSFHTLAPSSIFPSVGEITIPVATGAVKVATAVQTGPALGVLVQTAPNTYTISIPIPVEILVSGSAGGQAFGVEPTPALLAFAGTLTVNGASATFISSAATSGPIGPLPAPPAIVAQPFPLPTVLPAGSTANLLLSGTFSDGSGTSVFNMSIDAIGTLDFVLGDLNGDRLVNGIDLVIVLAAWGTSDPVADINHDGDVGGADLATMLSNWS